MSRLVLCALVLASACGGDDGTVPADGGPEGGLDATTPPDATSADVPGDVDAGHSPGDRLLSLNLHCLDVSGTAFETNAARWAAVAERMVAEGVRVALLQEVCDDGTTSALAVLETELETRTGESWEAAFALAHLAWEGTEMEAQEGVAILARGTLSDVEATDHVAQGGLRRVAIEATLDDGLRVLSFHLDHMDAAVRERQARELAVMALVGGPSGANVIAAGDLNARAGTGAHDALLASGFTDATAGLRATRIDHVFIHRGASVGAQDAALVFDAAGERVSDHPGALVTLRARSPEPVAITEVVATADVGFGRFVAIRGNSPPLSWDRGWPLLAATASEWRWATTELEAAYEFKLLRDDTDWQTGGNVAGTAGTRTDVVPVF